MRDLYPMYGWIVEYKSAHNGNSPDPVGYLVKHLLDDPTEAPPEAWAKKQATGLFDADFVKYVHGRPEHAQYCREHPEEVVAVH
jgi:hypothetical protein